ncbi:MAG: glycosyltransferase family 2 protein [Selenomonadaceae bacterium]|nr:glycosyltransferase family 2 protein [Selenomonadaceae bacterium]
MVDKNLFLHNLSVVAILKNEAPYLKEWLDYHLLAGVDHFYLYDNESPDNQAEVAKPYVEAGLVDYFRAPGKVMQIFVYNDAVKRFKFQSRYMAFIDGDEFIYPKTNQGIADVVEEILLPNENAAALAVNWQIFGSNNLETADYSRGVLERFTRRAPSDWTPDGYGNAHVKTILNPRKVDFLYNPHFAVYFEEFYAVNEIGGVVKGPFNNPVTVDRIAINHYYIKSREEYAKKTQRGRADVDFAMNAKNFDKKDHNEEFDDGILKYLVARDEMFSPEDINEKFERVSKNLIEKLKLYPSNKIVEDKLETALTCRALSSYLLEKFPSEVACLRLCEELSLKAILQSLKYEINFAEAMLFIRELPKLLKLPYPAVKEIRETALQMISNMQDLMRFNNNKWKKFIELDYIKELLEE